jgi:hypothetical protein
MAEITKVVCPECHETVDQSEGLDRRHFLRTVGAGAATLAAGSALPTLATPVLAQPAAAPVSKLQRPAENMVRDLWSGLTANQRTQVVKPWDHRSAAMLTRHRMVNAAIDRPIGQVFTAAQHDLLKRILRALCSDDVGYDRICRRESPTRAWDASESFDNLGADIFGEVADNRQWALVFSGHHLTVRCDGDSEPDYAFGGPIYYGHSPDGYSQRNLFFHQTRAVMGVYDGLSTRQREQATIVGTPGEHEPSIRFRPGRDPMPGLAIGDMSRSQRYQVYAVMREILSPYRREDADEVMTILRANGGLDKIHLAFYHTDREQANIGRWEFWRLEGPGFVWNYRVLPHVHCYVNIAVRPA